MKLWSKQKGHLLTLDMENSGKFKESIGFCKHDSVQKNKLEYSQVHLSDGAILNALAIAGDITYLHIVMDHTCAFSFSNLSDNGLHHKLPVLASSAVAKTFPNCE